MIPLRRFLPLLALGVLGGGACAVSALTPVAADAWLEFAAYPGARRLCSQHVTGDTMHIEWTAYASTDPHPKVIAFYVKRHGGKPEGDTLRLEGKPGKGTRLSVHPADKGSYPTCDVKPAKSDKTVIIVSQAVGPGVK
jgi:hypothetical protein